ncbi:MAG: type IV pilus assembly protein PilK [Polaribacter sp.]|jgi:type IV pilus assembly protein PilK
MNAFEIAEMKTSEFIQWQSFLELKTGMWLPEARKSFLLASLNRHMREMGIENYQNFYSLLNTGRVSSLDWSKIVDSVTVHETCFYRDDMSLKLVSNYCRNKVQKGFREAPEDAQQMHLWSVGCSTGEEAYSLAIEMDKLSFSLLGSLGQKFYYGVTGIDVSYPSLAVAREGIYENKKLNIITQTTKSHYFYALDNGFSQVKDVVRNRTCFIQGNVLELDKKKNHSFDVIYCQNLMIYFRQDKKEKILNSLIKKLKPGGLLVLGHGELGNFDQHDLVKVDNKNCLAFIKSECCLNDDQKKYKNQNKDNKRKSLSRMELS